MKYFSIYELSKSNVAIEAKIDNNPGEKEKKCLEALINNVLDPAREIYGKPIMVNSGFRCIKLNNHPKIKGAKNSQHTLGEAVDITAGSKEENKKLFEILKTLEFDQLIDEKDFTWIHVSFREGNNRKQILKL